MEKKNKEEQELDEEKEEEYGEMENSKKMTKTYLVALKPYAN